jgi:hypothetical protein
MSSPTPSLLRAVLGCRRALCIRWLAQQQRLEQRIAAGRVPDQHTLQAHNPIAAHRSMSVALNRGGPHSWRKLMLVGSIEYSLVYPVLGSAAALSLCGLLQFAKF